jgi:hypothetical protein
VDYAAVLNTIADVLAAMDGRFAVIGGWAMNSYGRGRTTFDLDLVVPRELQSPLIERLEALGYETLHRSAGYSNHLHADPAKGRLDLIYVDEETARKLFEAAADREVFPGIEAAVPSPEHLAAMKVTAMKNDPSRRLQELADIRALLRLPGVDRAAIRAYFERDGLGRDYDEVSRGL